MGGQPQSSDARIGPGDPRYRAILDKQFNKRFRASPEYVRLVSSTDQVVVAVEEAVQEKRRLVVTSGGHCLEGFVSDPDVRVLIDISPMNRVYHDPERRAVAVEAGATVGETVRILFEQWGTVIPLGEYPGIGIGGHVVGGAFGFLCRQLGLAADYLHAVEVVTVDEAGRASSTIATRTHRIHIAICGGRTPAAAVGTSASSRGTGFDRRPRPATILPRCCRVRLNRSRRSGPSGIGTRSTQTSFLRLLRNHGSWCERNSDADSPNASLLSFLEIHRKQFGKIIVRGVSTAGDRRRTTGGRVPVGGG